MKRVINGKTYSKVLGIKQGSLLTAGKDGDIEEYKADSTDAGKVLTVGEDGGIVPVTPGTGKTYAHNIVYYMETGAIKHQVVFTLFSDDDTPLTYATAAALLYKQGFKEAFKYSQANGCVARDINDYGLVCGINSTDGVNISVRYMLTANINPTFGSFTLPSTPTLFNDIVT